jgi:hypothetical protein
VAGAGPKSTASARKNVSETDTRTSTPGILREYVPARMPAKPMRPHSNTCGVATSACADSRSDTPPHTLTAAT